MSYSSSPSVAGTDRPFLMSENPSNRLEIARNWGRLCRYGSLALLGLPSRICRAADLERIDRLGEETAAALERDPACAAKYARTVSGFRLT